MLTDDQLAARIGPRLRAELADLPAPDMLAALRRRRARRARVTAALTTLPVAAAAIAAAVVLPGPAAPAAQQAQDTAYVASHVTQALDAVPASAIMYMQINWALNSVVHDKWASGLRIRDETFSAGHLVSESASTGTKTSTSVTVDYRDRTWSRSTDSLGSLSATAPAMSCANAGDQPIYSNPSWMAAELRTMVSCGLLKAGGTATAGGVTAIRLANKNNSLTWYVSPATYLPIRMTIARPGTGALVLRVDFQWLPPTKANLAKLNLPVAPRGFTQVQKR
jgi:hypothetical protein